MRIGIAQIDTTPGAFSQTVEHMVAQSQRAAEQGVELLVFPLAALMGIEVPPMADRVPFMFDVADALASLAERLACPALVSLPLDLNGPEGFYEVLLIERGKVKPLRMAQHLHGLFDSNKASTGDAEVTEFEFGGHRLALAVSYEDLDALSTYDYNVQTVLFLSAYSFALDDPSSMMGANLEAGRFVADAQTTNSWLVGVGALGCYGDQVFSGSSFVLSPAGDLMACAPAFEEDLLVAEVGGEADVPLQPEVFDAPFHLWLAVTLGIHDVVTKQGKTDVALLIDGSLGSQVLAALAVDALGPLHVHVVVGAQAGARAASCRQLVRRLRVNDESAPAPIAGMDARDTDELALADLARRFDAVALASWDKTMLALGLRSALHASSFAPLGDVYRSDILDMAHVRNTISPLFRKVTLDEADAIELPLPDGGTRRIADEAEVTALDELLMGYVEYDRSLATLVAEGSDAVLAQAALAAMRAAEPLRRALPPVLAMSTHTLDDVCLPLGMCWQDEHATLPQVPAELWNGTVSDGFAFGVDEQGQVLGFDKLGELLAEGTDVAPAAQDGAEDDVSSQDPEPVRDEVQEANLPAEFDLEGTLGMLRDLAEQGGFVPQEFMAAAQTSEGQTREQHGDDADAQAAGWFTPFSEN